jgi:hypothetical protein
MTRTFQEIPLQLRNNLLTARLLVFVMDKDDFHFSLRD